MHRTVRGRALKCNGPAEVEVLPGNHWLLGLLLLLFVFKLNLHRLCWAPAGKCLVFAPFTTRCLPATSKQPGCQPPAAPSLAINSWYLSPRIREQFPGTEMEKYALFIYESLKKTKCREFVPSRDEIEALIHRQEMTSMVYCHGGGSCKITINSHTTAGEVRAAPPGIPCDA